MFVYCYRRRVFGIIRCKRSKKLKLVERGDNSLGRDGEEEGQGVGMRRDRFEAKFLKLENEEILVCTRKIF